MTHQLTILDILQVEVPETSDLADRLPIVFPDILREILEYQLERLNQGIPVDLRRSGSVTDPSRPVYDIEVTRV